MAADPYLSRLDALIKEAAVAALSPGDDRRTEWGYGHACGQQLGLQRARQLFNDLLIEEANKK